MEEIIDDEVQINGSFPSLAKEYLRESAKWTKFLSIVDFVGIGLMIIVALMAGRLIGADASRGMPSGMGSSFITIIYLIMAVLYLYPILQLYNFSVNIKRGLNYGGDADIVEGLGNMKSMFKFMGVMTAIMLGIYALAIIIGIVVMAFK